MKDAGLAVTPLIAEMVALPETIPAMLPIVVQTAFEAGLASFKKCLYQKANLYQTGQLKFCILHNQERGTGDWHPLNDNDILKIFERLAFYQVAGVFAFIPGVGSVTDLAGKLGISTKEFSNRINIALKSFGTSGQQILEGLAKAGEQGINKATRGLETIANQVQSGVKEIFSDPVKDLRK